MTDDELMPDFVARLERQLRDEAERVEPTKPTTEPLPRHARNRWLAFPAVAVAVAAVVVLVVASTDRGTPDAYGKPLILQTPPVEANNVLKALQQGMSVMLVLGDGAKLTEARPVPAFGGTAFVVTGDRGWCLTAPDPAVGDPATADPTRTGAVTCARLDEVYRYGISLGIGSNVIAAIPDGAKKPTITTPDGATRDLEPSDQGVVVASDLPHRSALTLYGADGSIRSIRLP